MLDYSILQRLDAPTAVLAETGFVVGRFWPRVLLAVVLAAGAAGTADFRRWRRRGLAR